jgi:hypothetical protein
MGVDEAGASVADWFVGGVVDEAVVWVGGWLFCAYPAKTKPGASSKLLATMNSAGISFLRSILLMTTSIHPVSQPEADPALLVRPSMRVLASRRLGISLKDQKVFACHGSRLRHFYLHQRFAHQLGTGFALPARPHQEGVHQSRQQLRAFFIRQMPRAGQHDQLRLIEPTPQRFARFQ